MRFRTEKIARWNEIIGCMDDGDEKMIENQRWKSYINKICKDDQGK